MAKVPATVAAQRARAAADRFTMTSASQYPVAANSTTVGARAAIVAGSQSGCTTVALTSAADVQDSWVQSRWRKGCSGRRPSAMAKLSCRPWWPRAKGEPAPARRQPQPPKRSSRPRWARPRQIMPVPLIITMPAPSGKAPHRAVRSSPVTVTRLRGRFRAVATSWQALSCRGVPCSMPLAPTAAAVRAVLLPEPRAAAALFRMA